VGKAGRKKRGILPKRLRPQRPPRKPKPKSIEEKKKEVQNMIYQLEYRRAILPKIKNQRSVLIECALTDRINQGRNLLKSLKKAKSKNGKK